MIATRVDGNVLAGMLGDLVAGDATMVTVMCGGCGHSGVLAETVVEVDDVAAIVLCAGCTHTLFTVLRDGAGERVVFAALGAMEA